MRSASGNARHRGRYLDLPLIVRQPSVNQALVVGLLAVPNTTLQQQLKGIGPTNHADHTGRLVRGQRKAQLADWNTKAGALTGNTQIADRGDLESTTDTGAIDRGDDGDGAVQDGLQGLADDFIVIDPSLLPRGPMVDEFGNISPCLLYTSDAADE